MQRPAPRRSVRPPARRRTIIRVARRSSTSCCWFRRTERLTIFSRRFPGVTGTTTGQELVKNKHGKYVKQSVALKEVQLEDKNSLNHLYGGYITAYQGGAMDGFSIIKRATNDKPEKTAPVPIRQAESNTTLLDHCIPVGHRQRDVLDARQREFHRPSRLDSWRHVHHGGLHSVVRVIPESLIDDPDSSAFWGCHAKPGVTTPVINMSTGQITKIGPYSRAPTISRTTAARTRIRRCATCSMPNLFRGNTTRPD